MRRRSAEKRCRQLDRDGLQLVSRVSGGGDVARGEHDLDECAEHLCAARPLMDFVDRLSDCNGGGLRLFLRETEKRHARLWLASQFTSFAIRIFSRLKLATQSMELTLLVHCRRSYGACG